MEIRKEIGDSAVQAMDSAVQAMDSAVQAMDSAVQAEQCGWASGKFARPGSKPSYSPDQDFDCQHILLELKLNFKKKSLRGRCTTTFAAIHDLAKEIVFDAVDMKILKTALTTGEKLRANYDQQKLKVKLPRPIRQGEQVTIAIDYQVTNPKEGLYFIEPDKFYPKKPMQVWSHGEPEESRHWFPCFDAPHDKASTEMIVTVPENFFALSNGALLAVRENKREKSKSYHWKQAIPHSPYLVTLVAGKFSEIKEEWDGIPVLYYCQPGKEEDCKRAFGKTPKMMQFFSEKIGVKYPYEKYAQIAVADYIVGGMEHTTATTQTDRVLMDAKAYPEFTADWLVSHELAHQWFGDLLTCKEWSHAWLNESFATYFEALFREYDLGKEEFQYEMAEKLKSYLEEDKKVYRRAIVTNVYRKPDDLFDRHLYEKGSLVLHMLRHFLGEELWWRAIHYYVETFQGKAVETQDLVNAIQDSTGRNLRKIFDQFVYRSGHPEYTVHYWWDEKAKQAKINIQQKEEGSSLFSLAIPLEFVTASGKRRFTETIEKKKHEFKYRFSSEPLDFRFDPDHAILKTAEICKPYAMWVKQLQEDPHVMGRIQATQQIAKVLNPESLQVLMQAFKKEKFWGVAKEIALAIGSMRLEDGRKFLIQALKVKNPKVRRGVVEALSNFNDRETVQKLQFHFEKDPSYFVAAESLKSLTKIRARTRAAFILKGLKKESWNDTIRSAAISCIPQSGERKMLALVKKYSRYGMELASRISAVAAAKSLAESFPQFFSLLIELTNDKVVRLKHAAISALGDLKNPRAVPVLEKISKDKNLPTRTRALAEDALLKISPPSSL